jgi:WD40 repeat protein
MHQIYYLVLFSMTILSFCSLNSAQDILSFPPLERLEKRMVLNLELSNQDEFLITILSDATLRLFDMRKEIPVQILEIKNEHLKYAFSKDGMMMAISYKEKIDVYQLKPEFTFKTSIKNCWAGMITAISFTHDTQAMVFATLDRLNIVDIATQKNLFQRRLSSRIHGIASIKNNSIVTISQEAPMIWRLNHDYSTLLSNHVLEFYNLPSRKILSSSDGETIYIEDNSCGFISYNSTNTSIIGEGIPAEIQDSGMTISADGSQAALSVLNEINIYDTREKFKRIKKVISSETSFCKIAFSQKNNDKIYLGRTDGIVSIIDIN